MKAKLVIKRSIKSAAAFATAGLDLLRPEPGSVEIIAYHRVVADIVRAERDAIYGIIISTETFRKHCELLRRSFDVVSLDDAILNLSEKRKTDRPMAAITFDDGYLDFYEQAFPVLQEFQLPATVFLPTDWIEKSIPLAHDRLYWLVKLALKNAIPLANALRRAGAAKDLASTFETSRDLLKLTDLLVYLPVGFREEVISALEAEIGTRFEPYPAGYQLLDWKMIREMSKKGISFGGHTASHAVLPLENEAVTRMELEKCREQLESELTMPVTSFAYPNGEHNAAIRQMARNAGFSVAVTTANKTNRPGADPMELGRRSFCEESTRGIRGTYSPRVAGMRLGV